MLITRSRCLSDLNEDGRLTRDGFAIASHLMRSTLDGKALPATLPSSLVPPSLRSGAQPTPPPQKFAQEIQGLPSVGSTPPPINPTTTKSTQPPQQSQPREMLKLRLPQPHVLGFHQPPTQPQGTSLQMVQSPPSSGPSSSVASQNELDAQNAGIIDGLQGKGVQDSIDAMDEVRHHALPPPWNGVVYSLTVCLLLFRHCAAAISNQAPEGSV